MGVAASTPLSTLLSQALVAFTIELDNEFERRFDQAGGGARVASLVMWSNFLRVVGDGISVGELPDAVGLQKGRVLSTLGGMERWRYVVVASAAARRTPGAKRDGWGSARGLRSDRVVRPTPAGKTAGAIWSSLPDEIEGRWRERFGASEIDGLDGVLAEIDSEVGRGLPEFLPILGSADGMRASIPHLEHRASRRSRPALPTLLSHVLLAYTLDFENDSELSLALSANVLRVLDESGVAVRDLPSLAGVSKEAISRALTVLSKTDLAVVDGTSAASRTLRATPTGARLRAEHERLHARIEGRWETRFGADVVGRLRSSLDRLLGHRDLAAGLAPWPRGWRASPPYAAQTEALLADPRAALPHYPMVLHRGGWPDGS